MFSYTYTYGNKLNILSFHFHYHWKYNMFLPPFEPSEWDGSNEWSFEPSQRDCSIQWSKHNTFYASENKKIAYINETVQMCDHLSSLNETVQMSGKNIIHILYFRKETVCYQWRLNNINSTFTAHLQHILSTTMGRTLPQVSLTICSSISRQRSSGPTQRIPGPALTLTSCAGPSRASVPWWASPESVEDETRHVVPVPEVERRWTHTAVVKSSVPSWNMKYIHDIDKHTLRVTTLCF